MPCSPPFLNAVQFATLFFSIRVMFDGVRSRAARQRTTGRAGQAARQRTRAMCASSSMSRRMRSATWGSKSHISASLLRRAGLWKLLARLEFPGLRPLVIAADALVEAAGQPADRPLIPNVGGTEPARSQPADVPARLDEHDAVMHAGDLNRRRHAGRRPAIDHDIEMPRPAPAPARAADRGKEGSAASARIREFRAMRAMILRPANESFIREGRRAEGRGEADDVRSRDVLTSRYPGNGFFCGGAYVT